MPDGQSEVFPLYAKDRGTGRLGQERGQDQPPFAAPGRGETEDMLRRVVPEVIEDALFRLPEAAGADALAF